MLSISLKNILLFDCVCCLNKPLNNRLAKNAKNAKIVICQKDEL
jgi:hypothetical protein